MPQTLTSGGGGGGGILRHVLSGKSKKTRPYRRKEYRITVRSVKKDAPDPKQYARALIQLAAEQQGLTEAWARPELDALLAKFGGDSRVRDTEVGTDPRK